MSRTALGVYSFTHREIKVQLTYYLPPGGLMDYDMRKALVNKADLIATSI